MNSKDTCEVSNKLANYFFYFLDDELPSFQDDFCSKGLKICSKPLNAASAKKQKQQVSLDEWDDFVAELAESVESAKIDIEFTIIAFLLFHIWLLLIIK